MRLRGLRVGKEQGEYLGVAKGFDGSQENEHETSGRAGRVLLLELAGSLQAHSWVFISRVLVDLSTFIKITKRHCVKSRHLH